MMKLPSRIFGLTLVLLAVGNAGRLWAQPRGPAAEDGLRTDVTPIGAVGRWPLESLELKSGTVYRGLIQSEGEQEIEFMEVVRPPGKPMFLVIRPVAVADVAEVRRLDEPQRQQLIDRTNRFRNRIRIEAGRLDKVRLEEAEIGGSRRYRYRGKWFSLVSSADAETTRRCIVRIEQIFRAYRLIMPPRTTPRMPLQVLLLGSMDEYRAYLQRYGLTLENPSFYLARRNQIVAACELTRFAEHLARTRERHREIRETYERLAADLPQRLQRLTERLEREGFSRDQIVAEVKARQNGWAKEQNVMLSKIEAANRRNDAQFVELTRRMFRRLYHEACHAYLANYVYLEGDYQVPRWLNEGLAQVFESGQLDGDTLRIDAPDRPALLAVQSMIERGEPLPLEELLWSDQTDFLTSHGEAGGRARQIYYLSWALTYYLTFLGEKPLWGTAELDAYVTPDERGLSPTSRFVALVRMPLERFSESWRDALQRLKPPPD